MKYLLVTNSCMLPRSILQEIATNAIVVALDGAAHQLLPLGIKPNIIIGDLDSITATPNIWGITALHHNPKPYIGNFDTLIVTASNQNYTDYQKALFFLKHQVHQYYNYPKPSTIHIASSPGSRIDHELSNIFTLKHTYDPNLPIYLHEQYQSLEYVQDQIVTLNGLPGDPCGVFGLPKAKMSVLHSSLAYPAIDYQLSLTQHSSANYLITPQAKMLITGSALIVHPPMFASQRKFFNLQRHEQLAELLADAEREILIVPAHIGAYAVQNTPANTLECVSHNHARLTTLPSTTPVIISFPLSAKAVLLQMRVKYCE